jgi:hypothetical protein
MKCSFDPAVLIVMYPSVAFYVSFVNRPPTHTHEFPATLITGQSSSSRHRFSYYRPLG